MTITLLQQRQPLFGYLGAALLAYGALGPVVSSSFFGDRYFLLNELVAGIFLLATAAAAAILVYLRKYEWLWLAVLLAAGLWLLVLARVLFFTEAGQAQLAALPLGAAFTDFPNTYWGSLQFRWGVAVVFLGMAALALAAVPAIAATRARLAALARTKGYDVLVALPLILYFFRAVIQQAPLLGFRLGQVRDGTASLTGTLQLIAIVSSISFSLLLVILVFIRSVPVGKAQNLAPRIIAVLGTFAVTTMLYVPAVPLPLWLQIIAVAMIITGNILSFLVLIKLGRSFSIMPEARHLITTGPYSIVRHPLYLVEEIAVLGLLVQYASMFALGMAVAHISLQYMRTVYEERVLTETFPDYESYRAKTRWRFIPGLL